ncbi:hypothetical protein VSQ48_20150 [Candidatus Ventrimonas sp. KK005]
MKNTIYTHDEAALIIRMFEDILDTYDIKIPSPEDDERQADNEAKLYGSVYSDLMDDIEGKLKDLLAKCKTDVTIVEGEFSGAI